MKVTSKRAYLVVKAVLEKGKFTQYAIGKETNVAFSGVNRVVNWLVSLGYVAKRKGYYELVAPAPVFSLFPLNRRLKPFASFEIGPDRKQALELIKGKTALCLTTALSFYDDYFRDPSLHAYLNDENLLGELKRLPRGFTRVALYREDLSADDFIEKNGFRVSDQTRTVIDLFCGNKAYAAERLLRRKWS